MDWFDSEETEQRARDSLLKHYSSECTVHGVYLLSIIMGLLVFVQMIDLIDQYVIYPKFFITFSLSLFMTFSIYLIARTILWSLLASTILSVREITHEEAKGMVDPKRDKITLMYRLNQACVNYVTTYHRKLDFFSGVSRKNVYTIFIYLILFSILLLILHDKVISFLIP